MTTSAPNSGANQAANDTAAQTPAKKTWRPVDIIVAAVLGIACGLIFWVWNSIGGTAIGVFNSLTPGLGGLSLGGWLVAGVLGGLVIRKPGAAMFVEILAAIISALIGNQWGIGTVYSGIAQGLGAELIFFIFSYCKFGMGTAVLSGMSAAVFAWILELFTAGNLAKSLGYNVIYFITGVASGAVLAGVVGWLLVRSLATTGALDRFAAGREHRQLV